ncbi:MAG: hypothetical protein Ct9H300mP25_00630 [Acidobacteriota bacterium]|nr:MAG: hypothetical protein Ct9H300mP25_00630 [Acidobacteriota bacterium]
MGPLNTSSPILPLTPRPERKVRLTNEHVTEWQDGMQITLDEEGERRARAFVDARVFFPLLPYTLKGGDIRFLRQRHGHMGWARTTKHENHVRTWVQ